MSLFSLNKVVLLGNVGQEPVVRTMQDGRSVASFSLATTESWRDKDSGEYKNISTWHNITVWTPGLVKIVQSNIHKGSKLYVEGVLKRKAWTDNQGQNRTDYEITLSGNNGVLVLLDKRAGGDSYIAGGGDDYEDSGVSNQPAGDYSNNKSRNSDKKSYQQEDDDVEDDAPPF